MDYLDQKEKLTKWIESLNETDDLTISDLEKIKEKYENMTPAQKLAKKIWEQHIDTFGHFDLVCHNGSSLEDETKANALFNAIVTLENMLPLPISARDSNEIEDAIEYLKGSKYYSDDNVNSKY